MRRVVSTALVAIGVGLMAGPVLAATIIGTDDSETLMGRIGGVGGIDRIYGRDGNDVLFGGGGADWLYGGPGDDEIHVNDGSTDAVSCGVGNDTVYTQGIDIVADDCENQILFY